MNIPEGYTVEPSYYINDYQTVNRTWKERLFSWPWNPFRKVKAIYSPVAYLVGNKAFVSYKTYNEWKKQNTGISDPEKI